VHLRRIGCEGLDWTVLAEGRVKQCDSVFHRSVEFLDHPNSCQPVM
jgi:hypothetical protein